jgi:hypothetical protein
MKFTWKGKWREGEITIETENLEELDGTLQKLFLLKKDVAVTKEDFPIVSGELGIADAIRALLQTKWGRLASRSMAEIGGALEFNMFSCTKGTLSGTLRLMNKRQELERDKKKGKWVYTLKANTN